MQKMQSELAMMKNNLHLPPSSSASGSAAGNNNEDSMGSADNNMMMSSTNSDNMALATTTNEQSVTWKLSLSPSGLRIDTNIASVADLYRILLNGISQLNINNDSTTSLFNPESSSGGSPGSTFNNTAASSSSSSARDHIRRQQQQKATAGRRGTAGNYLDTTATIIDSSMTTDDEKGRLWEVDDNEARKILQEKKNDGETTLPKETLDKLMHNCYHTCFLAYQIVDKDIFMHQYISDEGLDPLLSNSINAWVSKHGCIYHHALNNSTNSTTTMGEVYFKNARQLLKKCFDISSPTTIHALLNLYMYQLSSERSSLAYLYIGLAIRMAQDLKFHKKEHMSADLNQRETNKRLWWSAYWLDLCAALESNRPTMVDDKDCDLDYPIRLDHEDDETGYRIHFAVYSIKLMRIRKDITKHLPSEQSGQSLLSAISRLENALTNWLSELPQDLHFAESTTIFQKTGSFRDEACLILNIQYQTTWIMLHKFFLPKQDQTATPVALLSLNICTKSANLITRMLSIYASNLNWCQFFYAMDGIIASVTIHQVNALSNEKEVSYLAQRNLIITASVLKESPLVYMVKVCEIIESIEGFLKKNGLSSDLNDLPPISEDSINQQSISSVFHPAVFESGGNSQHLMSQQQQQQQHRPSYTTSTSSNNTATNITTTSIPSVIDNSSLSPNNMMMNSPQSQHSSNIRVPSQLSSTMFQQQQAAGQQQMLKQQQQQQSPLLSHQQQQMYNNSQSPVPPQTTANSANMMVEPSMLFNDPTASLLGFNMGNSPHHQDMDQLLLRNMGFDLDNSTNPNTSATSTGAVGAGGRNQMYGNMFDNRSAPNNNTNPNNNNNNTNYNAYNNNESYGFNTNNYNNTTAVTTTAANNNNNTYPNFLNNTELFGIPTSATQQQQQQGYAQQQQFDPNALFNMDPATMNALLYNPVGGFGPNGGQGNQGQQGGFQDENDLLYQTQPANARKRVHRDWEDPS
jgi:hypothetical protein